MSSPGLSQIMVWIASIVDADISSLVLGWRNPFEPGDLLFKGVRVLLSAYFVHRRIHFRMCIYKAKILFDGNDVLNRIILFANFPRKAQTRYQLRYQPLSSVLISFQFIFGLGDALSLVASEDEEDKERNSCLGWNQVGTKLQIRLTFYVYVLSRWYVFSIFNLFHLQYDKVLGLSFRDTWHTHITPGLLRLL